MDYENKICELVEHFSGVSGIGLICLDKSFNKHQKSSSKWKEADITLLDYAEVIEQVQLLCSLASDIGCSYETFFTQSSFVYNIHLIMHSDEHICTLLTDPVLVQPLTEMMIQEAGIRRKSSIAKQIHFREVLLHVPVVSWQLVSQLGVVLQSMCCGVVNSHHIRQANSDTDKSYEQHQEMIHKTDLLLAHDDVETVIDEDLYRQVKHVIQTGDFEAMKQLLSCISLSDIPFSQNHDIDFLQTTKNSFNIICMMSCFCAIEAGYPYIDAMTLAHKLINENEKSTNMNMIFTNMKTSVSLFTTAVSQYNEKTYSKTMHNVMLFIQSRYQEHISLKEIAGHVGHHPNYLSSLVKRETGLPLFEHVNKVRVEMSKYDLQHTSRSVADIAQGVGFSHQNHYARIFKRMTGLTPVEFRSEVKRTE